MDDALDLEPFGEIDETFAAGADAVEKVLRLDDLELVEVELTAGDRRTVPVAIIAFSPFCSLTRFSTAKAPMFFSAWATDAVISPARIEAAASGLPVKT
ncbi:MAG: hypothetical protein AB7F09_07425 [Parvibaculaceae bacterium]